LSLFFGLCDLYIELKTNEPEKKDLHGRKNNVHKTKTSAGRASCLADHCGSQPRSTKVWDLYLLYAQPVFRYLYSRIRNIPEAEDAIAQTFLAALEQIPKKHDGYFASWLFSIARNKAMDYFRKQRKETPLNEVDLLSTDCQPYYLLGLGSPPNVTFKRKPVFLLVYKLSHFSPLQRL
jgi:hypothetical protein